VDCFVQILKGIEEIRQHQRAGHQGEAAPVLAHYMVNGQNVGIQLQEPKTKRQMSTHARAEINFGPPTP